MGPSDGSYEGGAVVLKKRLTTSTITLDDASIEGLPNREGAKPGKIGCGRSGGTRGNAGVTPPGLADRSEGSGQ